MLALLLVSAFRIMRNSRKTVVMFLVLIPYGIAANVSGYIWTCVPLLFTLEYGLSLRKLSEDSTIEIKEVSA